MRNKPNWITRRCTATLTLAVTAALLLSAQTANAGSTGCEISAQRTLKFCRTEAHAEFWLEAGKAANLPNQLASWAAIMIAWAEFKETVEECNEQYEARLEFCEELDEDIYNPAIDPADFDTPLPNDFYPLVPNVTSVFEGDTEDGLETIVVTITDDTREILGVECTIIRDIVYLDGEMVEDTFDYYAADNWGNIWYFGENTVELEDGFIVNTAGQWIAGEDGAKPGIIMLATPYVGAIYRQEWALSEAEDGAEVLSLSESVTVPWDSYEDCLMTRDFSPVEPDAFEYKFHASGIGTVKEVDPESGDVVELIEIID